MADDDNTLQRQTAQRLVGIAVDKLQQFGNSKQATVLVRLDNRKLMVFVGGPDIGLGEMIHISTVEIPSHQKPP